MATSMLHNNKDQMVGINILTTGPDKFWHEIAQVAIIPLDSNLEIRKEISPFYVNIQPEMTDQIVKTRKNESKRLQECLRNGLTQYQALDYFEKWTDSLSLYVTKYGKRKRLIPIGFNLDFVMCFIERWLGKELFEYYFSPDYRDLKPIMGYINDFRSFQAEEAPYVFIERDRMLRKHEQNDSLAKDCLQKAMQDVVCYKQMCLLNWV